MTRQTANGRHKTGHHVYLMYHFRWLTFYFKPYMETVREPYPGFCSSMRIHSRRRGETFHPLSTNDSTNDSPPLMKKLDVGAAARLSTRDVQNVPAHPISIIVDNVRSIHNVGSVFRTSDAARIEHLYLTGYTGTPNHPDLHKTALGAQDVIPWSSHDAAGEVIAALQGRGYTLGVLEITDTPTHPSELDAPAFPLALVIGNEVDGVDNRWVESAEVAIEIPQYGTKQSLNVSVAYGIAIMQIVRRYRRLHGLPARPEEANSVDG